MTHNIKYQIRLVDFNNPVMEQEVHDTITKNVEGQKMSSFWKKHLTHPDAEALIKIDINKNTDNTYNGQIRLSIP